MGVFWSVEDDLFVCKNLIFSNTVFRRRPRVCEAKMVLECVEKQLQLSSLGAPPRDQGQGKLSGTGFGPGGSDLSSDFS